MANPTTEELREAVVLLADRYGYGKLYDRMVRLNAFVSRRKPPSPEALADRLYTLTGGLRRQVPATLAFHSLWTETFTRDLGEDTDKSLEVIAERINAAITEDERAVRDGKADELDAAIGEYEQVLTAALGPRAARVDMLLKAVTPVAERVRGRPLPSATAAPSAANAGSASSPPAPSSGASE
jgi:hypothetical protein